MSRKGGKQMPADPAMLPEMLPDAKRPRQEKEHSGGPIEETGSPERAVGEGGSGQGQGALGGASPATVLKAPKPVPESKGDEQENPIIVNAALRASAPPSPSAFSAMPADPAMLPEMLPDAKRPRQEKEHSGGPIEETGSPERAVGEGGSGQGQGALGGASPATVLKAPKPVPESKGDEQENPIIVNAALRASAPPSPSAFSADLPHPRAECVAFPYVRHKARADEVVLPLPFPDANQLVRSD
ncbi:hypothetical protein T484DRAFT_1854672 [Baffinella frigidus]|nr:hypothetical protein T484DRAFT_1854672 [Cryptophyta sp. CCMP2293]